MSIRFALGMSSKLIAFVAALGLAATAAHAGDPVVIASTTWSTTGTMKAKVASLTQSADAQVTIEFGPSVDLLDGQFRLTVSGGITPFEIVGTYQESQPGKPIFDALEDDVAAALGLVPQLQNLDINSQFKATPKLKDGVETIRLGFKIRVKLSFEGQSMSIAVAYKGEGSHAQ